MKTVYQVLDLFYSTFGITPPRPGEERKSMLMLLGIVILCAGIIGGGVALVFLLR